MAWYTVHYRIFILCTAARARKIFLAPIALPYPFTDCFTIASSVASIGAAEPIKPRPLYDLFSVFGNWLLILFSVNMVVADAISTL